MKKVMVRSLHDAFDYVMAHYYPNGLEDMAERSDTYAVISIQDTHMGGYGFEFKETKYCLGVLTLYFDDIEHEVDGAVLFNEDMAQQIIDFIQSHKKAETLLVHCYAGQSRSLAVGAFAYQLLGGDNDKFFEKGSLNMHVYDMLEEVYDRQ